MLNKQRSKVIHYYVERVKSLQNEKCDNPREHKNVETTHRFRVPKPFHFEEVCEDDHEL